HQLGTPDANTALLVPTSWVRAQRWWPPVGRVGHAGRQLTPSSPGGSPMTADIVIRGGSLVDGTGAPARTADIALSDGVVSDIGEGLDGKRVLDASGHVVSPGFVDIHTHYDAQVFWDPALAPSCWHGVTSVVAGNCGFSIAPVRPEHRELLVRTLQHVEDMAPDTLFEGVPWADFETFPQYFDAIEKRGTLLNYACYVG